MLYERRLFLRYEIIRYALIDASTSRGHNWQMMREDRFLVPHALCADLAARANLDLSTFFDSRICPTSTLGKGRSSLVKNVGNCIGILLMESHSEDEVLPRRRQLVNICNDQGTEKDIADSPHLCREVPSDAPPGSVDSYCWPSCPYIFLDCCT